MRNLSYGIHCIRIRTAYGIVCLGIHSRNIIPVPDDTSYGRYDYNPSMYGWLRNCGRICNGRFKNLGPEEIERSNHVFALTLNCDEHRLSILNENTNEQDEMKVDFAHAPFPWCLFVQLSRTKGRLSFVQLCTYVLHLGNQNIDKDTFNTSVTLKQSVTTVNRPEFSTSQHEYINHIQNSLNFKRKD